MDRLFGEINGNCFVPEIPVGHWAFCNVNAKFTAKYLYVLFLAKINGLVDGAFDFGHSSIGFIRGVVMERYISQIAK
ncbi:MAG: hypothetical protein FD181_2489 [Prolixibacteraceae bacterium]|nr:MAG: hypothetical protein FD181_2489 [Prolixibacteraceae bacterium]